MRIPAFIAILSVALLAGCLWFDNDTPETVDGWTLQKKNGDGDGLVSVYFPVPDTGYAVGDHAVIFKTVDGGKSWIEQHREQANLILVSVHFINTAIGYAVGDSGYPDRGYFLRTSDGGENWTRVQDTLWSVKSKSEYAYSDLYGVFFKNDTGYVSVYNLYKGGILKTTNGGDSWTTIYTDTNTILDIDFPNPYTGYASGLGPNEPYGGFGRVYKTSNGGETWVEQYPPGERNEIYSIHFLNSDTGFVTGSEGIFRTLNGGTNWQHVFIDANREFYLNGIDFMDEQTGYSVGQTGFPSGPGVILKTTNGGATWFQLDYKIPHSLLGIHCPDSHTCYAVGSEILKHTQN